ncbi:hypothetical protein B0T19DRAFT_159745 [Cercophora scortea]|uniref:Uncharacterized protein n=1 Tax=Cercophora scortea TaxID=314031 RepID=A0AAE0ILQ0_9PEZI|nr:hypothetical protein B0T19DRAFT_159745 [Cercophora scortea]
MQCLWALLKVNRLDSEPCLLANRSVMIHVYCGGRPPLPTFHTPAWKQHGRPDSRDGADRPKRRRDEQDDRQGWTQTRTQTCTTLQPAGSQPHPLTHLPTHCTHQCHLITTVDTDWRTDNDYQTSLNVHHGAKCSVFKFSIKLDGLRRNQCVQTSSSTERTRLAGLVRAPMARNQLATHGISKVLTAYMLKLEPPLPCCGKSAFYSPGAKVIAGEVL